MFCKLRLNIREDCQSPDRWSLVGLELMEPDKKLRGGADAGHVCHVGVAVRAEG